MQRLLILLPLAVVAILAGCPSFDPPPPDLGPPPSDCASRPPAKVTVRAGHGEVDAGLRLVQGFQGGSHLWVNVQADNLGPVVLIEPAVTDAKTGELLSEADLQNVEMLEPAADGGFEPVTVQGRLAVDPNGLMGKQVTLSAKVSDACPHAATGELTGVVEQGFEESF